MTMQKLGNVLIQVMQDLSRVSTNGSAQVKINEHICQPEEFEQLFDYFSRGTVLDRIELQAEGMTPYMKCACGYEEEVGPEHNGYDRCPSCGRFADVKEEHYQLVNPDPENADTRNSIRF